MRTPNNLRLVVMAVLISIAASCLAAPSHFSQTVGGVLSCMDEINPPYFKDYMAANFGPPSKQQDGAWWWKVSDSIFGISVSEVFVSDGTTPWIFVGVITSLPPEQAAKQLEQSSLSGFKYTKMQPDQQYTAWRSIAGSVIAYSGKDSKIFCAGKNPWRMATNR